MPVNRLIKVLNVIVSVMAVIFLGLLLTSIFTSCKDKPNKPPVPQECPQMLNYPPRGISCIQCNVPKAEAQANKLVEILYKSCIQNPAISYLVDGSFGFNEQMMGSHIASLSSNGRKPHTTDYGFFYSTFRSINKFTKTFVTHTSSAAGYIITLALTASNCSAFHCSHLVMSCACCSVGIL